jgi:pilus assembly protein CpaB
MMQKRPLIMLLVAAVMGSIAVLLVDTFLQREVGDRSRVQRMRTVPVVVAAGDIKVGTKLDPLMLKTVDWPESSLPDGHFQNAQAVLGVMPPVALREIHKDEIVLAYKLSGQGARGGLPSRIPEDKRAISIPVTNITGVAGFVTPGDFVDVLHTTAAGRPDQIPVTNVLLQNVQVIGIDQNSSENETEPELVKAVTLLIDPESGQKIALAQATGTLSLLLRNEFDASLLATNQVTWHDLGPSTQAPPVLRVVRREHRKPATSPTVPVVAPLPAPQVEMVRGLKVTQQTVTDRPAGGEGGKSVAAAGGR